MFILLKWYGNEYALSCQPCCERIEFCNYCPRVWNCRSLYKLGIGNYQLVCTLRQQCSSQMITQNSCSPLRKSGRCKHWPALTHAWVTRARPLLRSTLARMYCTFFSLSVFCTLLTLSVDSKISVTNGLHLGYGVWFISK